MNKRTVINLILFLVFNVIGFTVGPLLFVLSLQLGIFDPEIAQTDAQSLQYALITTPSFIWLPCAVFSFAFFFLTSRWRRFFLMMPVVAPLIYSVTQIISFI